MGAVRLLMPFNGIHAFYAVDATLTHGGRGSDMCYRAAAVTFDEQLNGHQKHCDGDNSCCDEQ